jgi:hypothetical protein
LSIINVKAVERTFDHAERRLPPTVPNRSFRKRASNEPSSWAMVADQSQSFRFRLDFPSDAFEKGKNFWPKPVDSVNETA